jgi:hypothetical protein
MPFTILPLLLGLNTAAVVHPGIPAKALSATTQCPGDTEAGRRIATRFVTDSQYAAARHDAGVPALTPAAVRSLSTAADADACRRIMDGVRRFVQAKGGNLGRLLPVLYEAGGYYIAVLTQPPRHTPTPGGALYIDGRWTPLYVLNRDFEVTGSSAM